ncbi:MAG: phosphomethylpyrimidine synthase ThiC [Verrucomicrobia bacterium]|nr:phosphomethylpyrimidine synthase ThiC [Verrucomicrobiota bacterium]MBU1733939.1 phosphomethylpyrimidine synthase ThiC [Verrucomicrobiota bacterium]MBU1857293.1 phosphomethylpyrimidine synthase ThiC [Verrucomicrobiota bacterium]
MMTQYEKVLGGEITPAIRTAARRERVAPEQVRDELARGTAVLPFNPAHHALAPAVVGRAFTIKVNANIGRSTEKSSNETEIAKMHVALTAGTDFLMDLSVGPNLGELRRAMIVECPVPFGTVPIYEAFSRVGKNIEALSENVLLEVIREQAEQGVDFMTIHAGLLRSHIPLAFKRMMGIVSRGGALIAEWMVHHERENPFFSRWKEILDICHCYDVTISLGDGLRPGCLADASDEAQFAELDVLGTLVKSCREHGVQAMVEGPGHLPFNQIEMNMKRQQWVCDGAPFFVLGPVVTDIAPGYDHITSCIGATMAAYHGAALLCCVTPSEHLGLPTADEVKAGVMAYRIAAHAADVAKSLPGARARDDEMTRARKAFDWKKQFELAIDGETARQRYEQGRCHGEEEDSCSMCGKEFCAIRNSKSAATAKFMEVPDANLAAGSV